ncbi:hypothetical protein JVT61DRAFT_10555 [Boletus reticuloceps]|uniref:DUF6532 domain-containing protein n=1 Tax=Boletus reticuloceps TaxID=495285 RepID=A0A8I3AC65_9AGAM|nr:hypothetical protein JVT61DRAFT_10555 [Boletus reticuloceps]
MFLSQAISTWNPTLFDQPEPNPDINPGFTPGPYTVQENPSTYFQSSLPLPALPALPSIVRSISDQSYNAAPSMVWASVPQTAVLAHHQQQCGTSDVPSQVQHQVPGVNLHSGVSTLSTPTSWYSHRQVSQAGSRDVDYLNLGRTRGSQSQRDEQLEQVIKFASIALVNEMALNCGWRHKELSDASIHARQIWSDKINECIIMACVRFSYSQVDPSDTTAKRIVRSLSTFHSKMALMAESYGKKFLQVGADAGQAPDFVAMQQQVAQITDPSIPGSFFLHQQNNAGEVERLFGHHILEEFHLDCWYTRDNSPVRVFKASYNTTTPNMLALSSIVVRRCSNQGNTIKFSTETYADHFNNYQDGILAGLRHPSFSQPLSHRLDWLNAQGKERLHNQGPASPQKLRPIVIPPAVAASVSATSKSARASSPAHFNNPALVAGTSTSGQSFYSSYFPAQMGSTSSSLFSAQLPSSGSNPGGTPNVPPSTSYHFTDPFM